MKTGPRNLLFVFICLFFIDSSAFAQRSPIEGTWKLLARQWQPQHKEMADAEVYKIFTEKHWLAIGMNPKDHSLYWAMGGTYTLKDANYLEKIEFFNLDPSWVGNTYTLQSDMAGNFLHQHAAKESSNGPGVQINAFYERVEPSLHGAKEMNPVAGVWDIVSAQYGENKADIKEQYGRVLKIITPSYFAGVFFNPETGDFYGIAFGKQKVIGNKYVEDVMCFSWDSSMSNEPQSFTWEIRDGQFIQKGELNSAEYKEYIIHEVSNRVE